MCKTGFILLFTFITLSQFSSCIRVEQNFSKLPPGIWRATLNLEGEQFSVPIEKDSEIRTLTFNDSKGELPFNFEVIYTDDTTFYIELINGTERIRVDDVKYGRDFQTAKDTVKIEFKEFDSYILAIFVENKMEGYWHVNYKEGYQIPFIAIYGQKHRFNSLDIEPNHMVSGTWEALFDINGEFPYPAKAIFHQDQDTLNGTFLTETGDYRYLSGSIQGDKIFLSCFDGAHAFLFEAKIMQDSSIYGIFRSGTHYLTEWTAIRNKNFELKDPYHITSVKADSSYTLNNLLSAGKINLNDPYLQSFFSSKVKLVQFMGTWCPNCKDEVRFLQQYKSENPEQDLGILALCFERYKDPVVAQMKIEQYKIKMNIKYPLVYAGYYDKQEVSESFPMLNQIIAYPTLFFIDQNNEIVKIHTGFSGPATDIYRSFSDEFHETVQELLKD